MKLYPRLTVLLTLSMATPPSAASDLSLEQCLRSAISKLATGSEAALEPRLAGLKKRAEEEFVSFMKERLAPLKPKDQKRAGHILTELEIQNLGEDMLGGYTPAARQVALNESLRGKTHSLTILVHELQHMIDDLAVGRVRTAGEMLSPRPWVRGSEKSAFEAELGFAKRILALEEVPGDFDRLAIAELGFDAESRVWVENLLKEARMGPNGRLLRKESIDPRITGKVLSQIEKHLNRDLRDFRRYRTLTDEAFQEAMLRAYQGTIRTEIILKSSIYSALLYVIWNSLSSDK